MTPDDEARAVYREFDPGPPAPEHLEKIYVDLDEVRGGVSVTDGLQGEIALSDVSICRLFTGHRGCGKTTELLRLKERLERDAAHTVVMVSSEHLLDLNDIDFPDLLIAIVREIAEQLQRRFGIALKPSYLADRFERIRDLLVTPIELGEVGISSGFLELGLQMKQSPEARYKLRAALEPDTSNLIAAVNDLLGDVRVRLRKKGLGPLVLVVDDIDKISMRMHDSGVAMGEYLFVGRYPQMSGLDCHVVYTIPLALAYSINSGRVTERYGGSLPVVPRSKSPHDRRGARITSRDCRGRGRWSPVASPRARSTSGKHSGRAAWTR